MNGIHMHIMWPAALLGVCAAVGAGRGAPRVVYHDPAEAVNWVRDGRMAVEFLNRRGFGVVNAAGLVAWLEARIQAGAPDSVVVIGTGVLPERAADPRGPKCLLKRYVNAGGRVVWLGVEPLLYVSAVTPPLGRVPWRVGSLTSGGQGEVLGVTRVAPGSHGPPAITDAGRRWGMRVPDDGHLPVPAKQVTAALSASRDGVLAYSWFKNFNPRYPLSGVVRYHAGIYCAKDRALNEDLYRIAMYGGQPVLVPTARPLPAKPVRITLGAPVAVARSQPLQLEVIVTPGTDAPKRAVVRTTCYDGRDTLGARDTAIELTGAEPTRTTVAFKTDSWALRDYRVEAAVVDGAGKVLASADRTVAVRLKPRVVFPFGPFGISAESPEQGERIMADLAAHGVTMAFLGDAEPTFLACATDQALKYDLPFAIRTGVFYEGQHLAKDPAARMKSPEGKDMPLHVNPAFPTACLGQAAFCKVAADAQRRDMARVANHPAFSKWVLTSDDVHLYNWACYCADCTRRFRAKHHLDAPKPPTPEQAKAKKGILPDNDPWVLWTRFRSREVLGGYNAAVVKATEAACPGARLGPISGGVTMHVRHGHIPSLSLNRFGILSFYYYPHYLSPMPGWVLACGMARMGNRDDRPVAPLGQSYSLGPPTDYSYADEAFVRNEFYTLLAGGAQAIMFFAYTETLRPTWASMAELGAVARRLGPLFARLRPGPAKLGFLVPYSTAAYEPGWPMRGGSAYASFINLLRTHHQIEPVGEGEIIGGRAAKYKGIVVANVDWLSRSCHRKLVEYQKQGGVLLADKGTEVPLPLSTSAKVRPVQQRLRKIAFDATTPSSNTGYPIALNPGVAHRIRAELDRLWSPLASAASEDLIIRTARSGRARYVWVVDTYRVDEFERLRSGKGDDGEWARKRRFLAERGAYGGTVTHTLRVAGGPYTAYDVVAGRRLRCRRVGTRTEMDVTIPRLGGTLVGLYRSPVEAVHLDVPSRARSGDPVRIRIRVEPQGAGAPAEFLPLALTVTEPDGTASRYSCYEVARNGELTVTLPSARNDRVGRWTVRVRELSSGLAAQAEVELQTPKDAIP